MKPRRNRRHAADKTAASVLVPPACTRDSSRGGLTAPSARRVRPQPSSPTHRRGRQWRTPHTLGRHGTQSNPVRTRPPRCPGRVRKTSIALSEGLCPRLAGPACESREGGHGGTRPYPVAGRPSSFPPTVASDYTPVVATNFAGSFHQLDDQIPSAQSQTISPRATRTIAATFLCSRNGDAQGIQYQSCATIRMYSSRKRVRPVRPRMASPGAHQ